MVARRHPECNEKRLLLRLVAAEHVSDEGVLAVGIDPCEAHSTQVGRGGGADLTQRLDRGDGLIWELLAQSDEQQDAEAVLIPMRARRTSSGSWLRRGAAPMA